MGNRYTISKESSSGDIVNLIIKGNDNAIKKGLEKGIFFEENPLLYACAKYGDLHNVKKLIGLGANIEIRNYSGKTPLHAAVEYGHFDMVVYLIEKGANIYALNRNKHTPLHGALIHKWFRVANYFLKNDYDVNAKLGKQ